MTHTLSIGWAETDTTPTGTVDLSGQYYHRITGKIHSRLTATALALESGTEQAVMVALELVGFQSDFQDDLRALLRLRLPELDTRKVFLNVTHTHNAPGVDLICGIAWLAEPPGALPVADYREFLLEKLVGLVETAWQSRRPGGIGSGLGFARIGHCRRAVYADDTAEMYGRTDRADFIGMESGEDSGVDVLFTFDETRQPTGVVLNLACPSQTMEATYEISSDFVGETRCRLKQRFGADFKVLAQISAAGCQSPRDLPRNYKGEPDFWHADGVTELGRRLTAAVEATFPACAENVETAPLLQHAVRTIALPRRRASYQAYVEAKARLAKLEAVMDEASAYRDFCGEVARNEKIPNRPGPYDDKLHHFVLIQNNRAVVTRYESQDATPTFEIEMHVLRLGAVVFVTNPFELYLDFGQQIKARSRAAQTFVVQLCGGTGGYLPSARAEQLGGYGGLIINGTVGSDGGKQLVDATVGTIAELWGQP
jgi:hypothetical protein